MTDRELLELAAKAAGVEIVWRKWPASAKEAAYYKSGLASEHQGECYRTWNPLTDDGDALRLAVKLRISLTMHVGGCMATDLYLIEAYESYGDDRDAAARRAIVRAAAELGKQGGDKP